MATDTQGDQRNQEHSPDEFGFESDVDLLLYAVVQHMREEQFEVVDRDFILRSFLPSHAQQALTDREKYTHPNDWMLSLKFGRNKDNYEDHVLTEAGFPKRHPDTSMYMHIKDQLIYLNTKYPKADWTLLMEGLFDRLAARTIEQAPDPETMRRSSLYTAFVSALDDEGNIPRLDIKGEGFEPNANYVIHTISEPGEPQSVTVAETITVEEIHLRLGCDEPTVKAYLKSGEIPGGRQTGHAWIVNREVFEVWFRGKQAVEPSVTSGATMGVREVAQILGMTEQTIRRFMTEGSIPFAKKIRRNWVVPREPFMEWLKGNDDAVRALSEPKPRPTRKPKEPEPTPTYRHGRSASF